MKTFLFVGTGFVKPQGNDLHGYGRVLALKPTATGLVLHYKMATAGGVTGIQSLTSKTVLDKLRVKTPAELRKEAEEKKAKQCIKRLSLSLSFIQGLPYRKKHGIRIAI